MKRVLIIEDDREFCEVVSSTLATQYQPLMAHSGQEGLRLATHEKPDLILVDLHMPEMDGFEVCQQLRARPGTRGIPIIILTAESQTDSRIKGFDVGADDYISKPFHVEELMARIRARLRRKESESESVRELVVGNLRLEPRSHQVRIGDCPVHLTQVEFQVLRYLLENANQMISRERLLGDLWPDAVVTARTVDTHIAHLRKKLRDFDHRIKTVFRGGYMLEVGGAGGAKESAAGPLSFAPVPGGPPTPSQMDAIN